MARESRLVDVQATLLFMTDKAYRLSRDGEEDSATWVPKSQCEVDHERLGGVVTVTLPERVAIEKRLV